MEKINLTQEELKDFLKKYNAYELETMKGLFEYAKDYDLDEATETVEEIQKERIYAEDGKDFRVKELNDKELSFLHDIVDDANFFFKSVMDLIDYSSELNSSNELLSIIDNEILTREYQRTFDTKKKFKLNETQLRKFYNKYTPVELEEINKLFEFVFDYDKEKEVSILKEVHNKQIEEASKTFDVYVRPTSYRTSNLKERNIELSKKELNFLLEVTLSHFDGIMAERDIQMEDYIEDINLLIISIDEELSKRNIKNKSKIK